MAAGGELAELVNLAEILENHEFRRCGGVPFGPGLFSIEPDRESRLEALVEFDGLGLGCPFCCGGVLFVFGVPWGLRGSCDGVGMVRGCDGAGVVLGGEVDVLFVLSVVAICQQETHTTRLGINNSFWVPGIANHIS